MHPFLGNCDMRKQSDEVSMPSEVRNDLAQPTHEASIHFILPKDRCWGWGDKSKGGVGSPLASRGHGHQSPRERVVHYMTM